MSSEKATSIPTEHCWSAGAAAFLATKRVSLPGRITEKTQWLESVVKALALPGIEILPTAVTEQDVERFPAIPADKHAELLQLLILASLTGESKKGKEPERAYTALSRALVLETARLLKLQASEVYTAEATVAKELLALLQKQDAGALSTASGEAVKTGRSQDTGTLSSASGEAVKSARSSGSALKWAATGAGFVLGGVAIGLSGGLAAPLLISASGGLLGIFGGAGGAVALGTMLGLGGGGLTAYRAKRRMEGIETFEFEQVGTTTVPSLHATIVMSGLLLQPDQYISPYQAVYGEQPDRDVYAIKTDPDDYLATGKAVEGYVLDFVIKKGAVEVVKRTALAAIYTAVALPLTVYKTAAMFLDNRWQRTKDKASAAGRVLADVLADQVQGKRPVTLIGSSLGAVTIFNALLELQKRGDDMIVFDVILISSPMAPSPDDYARARSVVSRRFVNVSSSNDWVLGLLARLHSVAWNVAGIQALPEGVAALGIESIDVSDILPAHLQLSEKLPDILARVDLAK